MRFHKSVFAHRYSTTCYDFRFSAAPHKMELTFFEKGDVVKMWEDGAQQHIAEGTFQFATFDRPFRVYSQASACSHTTVGFKAAYHLTTISREELLACNRLDAERPLWVFLPSEGFRPQGSNPMEQLLRRLITLFAVPEAAQNLHSAALLFDLLAALTDETVRMAILEGGVLTPSGIRYAQRAVQYIVAHLSKKITMDELGAELGICPSYLSALFKAYTGKSVIDYTNAIRIERVKELMLTRNLRLREAGESVGLTDENYASRLFKKYTGLSVREYLRLMAQ